MKLSYAYYAYEISLSAHAPARTDSRFGIEPSQIAGAHAQDLWFLIIVIADNWNNY